MAELARAAAEATSIKMAHGATAVRRKSPSLFPVAAVDAGWTIRNQHSKRTEADADCVPRPMNIDSSGDQLTMADCLYLTATQQEQQAIRQQRRLS